jgi:hypothetical protein
MTHVPHTRTPLFGGNSTHALRFIAAHDATVPHPLTDVDTDIDGDADGDTDAGQSRSITRRYVVATAGSDDNSTAPPRGNHFPLLFKF